MSLKVSNKWEKILVTGSSGSIGKVLCPFLMKHGYNIRGFDTQYGENTNEFILGNIQDKETISKAIQGIDVIIHLAAYPDDSYLESDLIPNNIIGLKVLLDQAKKKKIKKIIFASSIHTVDFTQEDKHYSINDRSPFNYYGLSKVWGEDLLELFSKQYNISVIIARLGWFIRSEKEFNEACRIPNGKDLYLSPNDLCEFFMNCLKEDNLIFEKLYVTSIPEKYNIFDLKPTKELVNFIPKDKFPVSFTSQRQPNSEDSEINLIQITDTHIFGDKNGLLYGVNTFNRLKAVIQHIKKSTIKIDGIIITGDLSEDGSTESYINLKREIDKLNIPSYWLPGNHDNFDNIPKEISSEHVHGAIKLSNWDLILLDTTVRNEDYGFLHEKELERLEQFLIKKQDSQILICMHHPPNDVQSDFIDSIGLKNKNDFWEILSSYSNIKGILVGHIHQKYNQMIYEIPVLSTFSTCIQWEPLSKEFRFSNANVGYQYIQYTNEGNIISKTTQLSKFNPIDQ